MPIPPALRSLGMTFGIAAAVGTVTYAVENAIVDRVGPDAHDTAKTVLALAGAIGMGVFLLTPGLPSRPMATGVIMGLTAATQLAAAKA